MYRLTISVPKGFKHDLDRHPDINWPEVMKQGIVKRLESLEKMHARGEL